MGKKIPVVYITANRRNGTLYTGVTGYLGPRSYQHRIGRGCNFTSKYGCSRLVYYEILPNFRIAIAREKEIKKKTRIYKINLIERNNPDWSDLFYKVSHMSAWD